MSDAYRRAPQGFTPQQRLKFDRDGYLSIENALSEDVVRKNIFLAYCPSWIVAADHLRSDAAWLDTLNREQGIIMRDYDYAYDHTKPPAPDFPLFLDRETGLDHDENRYHERVAKSRRKRMLAHEKA